MPTEAGKLHIIQAVLKTEDDAVLQAIETIINKDNPNNYISSKHGFSDLIGTITPEEAEEMKQTIEANFEQINPDDWK
jgi:hypothetical protein